MMSINEIQNALAAAQANLAAAKNTAAKALACMNGFDARIDACALAGVAPERTATLERLAAAEHSAWMQAMADAAVAQDAVNTYTNLLACEIEMGPWKYAA